MQDRFGSWPNGARIAVAITPMFEVWPEGKGLAVRSGHDIPALLRLKREAGYKGPCRCMPAN